MIQLIYTRARTIAVIALLSLITALPAGANDLATLDGETQELKASVLDLNRELFVLEEELLYPANTQVAVFVSMDVGEYFALDSIELPVDGKNVSNYLYTDREVDALYRGGVHKLYLGNLKVGEHELVAVFTGRGPHERDYRRGAALTFEKSIGAKYVELQITDLFRFTTVRALARHIEVGQSAPSAAQQAAERAKQRRLLRRR